MNKKLALIFFVFLFLHSCKSLTKDENDEILPAETWYQRGLESLEKNKYADAADYFSKIYFQHPGGDITPYAEIMEAYSHFMNRKFEDASDVIDNFIKLYPTHSDIEYAYYLKTISDYMQISPPYLDQSASQRAKQSLIALKNRFPNSKYSADISKKISTIDEYLSAHEMEIGIFYQKRKRIVAAINRYQIVIKDYPNTSFVPEAYYRITESYKVLGLEDKAEIYKNILQSKFSNSIWAQKF